MFAGSEVFQHDESTATPPACKQIAENSAESSAFMPSTSLQIEHLAMATRWRLVLRGADAEALAAVGSSCTAMIDNWDHMLSRFATTSEVRRVNRTEPTKTLKLHLPLLELLKFCDLARQATHGLFEVALPTAPTSAEQRVEAPYQLDWQRGTFTWHEPHRALDFGGVAKGYVVDQLLQFVKEHHVTAALFDAGGSSVLAWDAAPNAAAWRVKLSGPGESPRALELGPEFARDEADPVPSLELQNAALAYSATRLSGTSSGQTVDPRTGSEIADSRACVVVTASSAWAEVLSTTALCMGEAQAAEYIKERGLAASRLGWLDGNAVRWYSSDE